MIEREGVNRMNRHQAREKAFQVLYQLDLNKNNPEDAIEYFLGEEEERNDFFLTLVKGVTSKIEAIDEAIKNNLTNWSLDRIATAEKTILRIATFELIYMDDIPEIVSINEAVELAKAYGDEKSGKFVNGVLSKINV